MAENFTKLFGSITASTVWMEDSDTRIVWVTMLAMSDQYGYVGASIPGLASIARVPVEKVRAAIAKFLAPDPDSRSKDHDGRRIEEADRGWTLLNYERFRELRDEDIKRENDRIRQRRHRENKRDMSRENVTVTECNEKSQTIAQAEADPDLSLPDLEASPSGSDPDPERAIPVQSTGVPTVPMSAHAIAQLFGRVRADVIPGALAWTVPRNSRENKADAIADTASSDPGARADLEISMRLLFDEAKAGTLHESQKVLDNVSYAFGVWVSDFTRLREKLHGRAMPLSRASPASSAKPGPQYRKLNPESRDY